MPTATEPAPTHDVPSRGLLGGRVSAITVVLASIATLAILFGILQSSGTPTAQMQSVPAQPNTVTNWVAAPPKPTTVAAPTPTPKPAALAIDERGFVDTAARCGQGEEAVAIARTARSAMVVCQAADGSYEYQGIRLRDGASLRLDDVRVIPTGFEAHNDGTTYRLSQTALVVIAGEALQSRDAIVEYRAG